MMAIQQITNKRIIKYDTTSPNFKPEEPKKPIIGIHTRDQRDAAKTIKSFYLQFLLYTRC